MTGAGQLVEVDELQHFTTARTRALELYPAGAELGYDLDQYRRLCEHWHPKADKAFAHRTSADFPRTGGRQAQRAYNDALRDLLAPVFTGNPVIRIAAPDRNLTDALAALSHLRDR